MLHAANQWIPLSQSVIQSQLLLSDVYVVILETVDSTNTAVQSFPENAPIMVCLAEAQTGGRGRLGRTWHSPFGENLYLSLRYTFRKSPAALSGLSLVAGIALCDVLTMIAPTLPRPSLKWPNDVWIHQQKIAGILVEVQVRAADFCQVVIGVGVNVNMQNIEGSPISQPWTSIVQLTHAMQDRNVLAVALINRLSTDLRRFESEGLRCFIDAYDAYALIPYAVCIHKEKSSPR